MHPDLEKILYTEDEIKNAVSKIANEINRDYTGKKPILIVLLKGSFVFASDLIRALTIDCKIDFMIVSSYGNNAESSGSINVIKDIEYNISDKDIIVIEDVVDTGITLNKTINMFKTRNPNSIKSAVLLDKPSRRKIEFTCDYCGLTCNSNEFIVGYGLDYQEFYRNLPYIGILKKELYS